MQKSKLKKAGIEYKEKLKRLPKMPKIEEEPASKIEKLAKEIVNSDN
ncbi:MAG: hypothetical protein GF317_06900 [Candidatus Lokiarchaeota archaeon]|nr:hypothetical protein [Candidatus Lokiarchaeota archaeon]